MNEIVIIGGGGHAKVIISIIIKSNVYKIVGYTDVVDKGEILGVRYLGSDIVLHELKGKYKRCFAVIGIGVLSLSGIDKRIKIRSKLEQLGYDLPVIISPTAVINTDVKIGKGTVVFDGAIINAGTYIGENVIINTGALIEHDCQIGDNVHVACGAILGGGVTVGNSSMIGLGAKIIQYKKIGEHCMIGAGAVVVNDCSEQGEYLGIPAKRLL